MRAGEQKHIRDTQDASNERRQKEVKINKNTEAA